MNKNWKKGLTLAALMALTLNGMAANPFLPLWEYIPDGEPYIFEDPDKPGEYRVYIYGSHDSLIKEYCGREQVVWSAPLDNLNNWRYDGVIFVSDKDANGRQFRPDGKGDVLYAPDIANRMENGKMAYYLYPNNQEGGRQSQIARAERPNGPFTVFNWSKKNPNTTDGILGFDPAVFVDDDGRVYGYWGFEQSFGAELDPVNMASPKKGTKIVKDMVSNYKQDGVFRFFEASSMRKIKDKYVFIYSRWTEEGEFGLPTTNYTLAYAYSNNPLGPFTYGGTIIDCRGRDTDLEGNAISTATFTGNTHGSIVEINGQWFVFYHRQTGGDEFSRQAMVSPITVNVTEGPQGKVEISQAEYTSEGFELDGLNPYKTYSAGIACYYTGPRPATQEYPNMYYTGSYVEPNRIGVEQGQDPYSKDLLNNPMVNNTSGSVIGYKYYNMSLLAGGTHLIELGLIPQGIDGTITVMIDSPYTERGGKVIGSISIKAKDKMEMTNYSTKLNGLAGVEGKHALYLVFSSEIEDKSICTLQTIRFMANKGSGCSSGK